MQVVVIGAGYTGRRVISLLPAGIATGTGQQALDLDDVRPAKPNLPEHYAVLYTVPPRDDAEGDPRLAGLLSLLAPAPARIVYLSTTGIYGNRNGRRVTEADAPAPETDRARRRLAAESLLANWCKDAGTEQTVLRVPGIYGPGRLGLDRIKAALPVIAEQEAGPGNRIHVDDLALCCVKALAQDAPAGIFNVGDGDHRSGTWFAQTVARLAGYTPLPEISRAMALETFSEMRLSFLRESRIVDTGKLRRELAFTPVYQDAEDGIRASLAAEA